MPPEFGHGIVSLAVCDKIPGFLSVSIIQNHTRKAECRDGCCVLVATQEYRQMRRSMRELLSFACEKLLRIIIVSFL